MKRFVDLILSILGFSILIFGVGGCGYIGYDLFFKPNPKPTLFHSCSQIEFFNKKTKKLDTAYITASIKDDTLLDFTVPDTGMKKVITWNNMNFTNPVAIDDQNNAEVTLNNGLHFKLKIIWDDDNCLPKDKMDSVVNSSNDGN